MSVLEIEGLEVAYERRGHDPVRAVVDASLTVGRGEIVGLDFLVELKSLHGRQKLIGYPVHSTIIYP